MPTVNYKCGDTGKMKTRNAVGKAQATEFAKTMGGTKTDNPNTRMTEMGY